MMFMRWTALHPSEPLDEKLVAELTAWWIGEHGMRSWQENVELFLREYECKRRSTEAPTDG